MERSPTQRPALIPQHLSLTLPEELKHCTGKGVKVAVIDSGIDLNSPMAKNVKDGIGIGWDGEKVFYHDDIRDENGHGTKICEILLSHAPEVELHIARIFEKRLLTDMECLVSGIRWAVDNEVNVINVSLGTTAHRDLKALRSVCKTALKNNIFVVSSLANGSRRSYPGWFSGVLCVYDKDRRGILMRKNHLIGMSSDGERVVKNSFLVPVIAGMVAQLHQHCSSLNLSAVMSNLNKIIPS